MALDWLPTYPDWLIRPASPAIAYARTYIDLNRGRVSGYPVLDLDTDPGNARVSGYPVLDLDTDPGRTRISGLPVLILFIGGFDWLPTYPNWFPPRQKAREGQSVLARAPGPFSVTQYVIEAWLPNDESEFINAPETIGNVWVEVTFEEP